MLLRTWPSAGLEQQALALGNTVADELRQVLDYIVSRYVVDDEIRSIDRDAPVTTSVPNDAEKIDAAKREEDRANRLADAFDRGLVRTWQRYAVGGNELPLDDRKPDENAMADALIRFLVSYNLASSRTEETGPMTYTYYVSVNWPKLRDVAQAAGVDLDRVLDRQAQRAAR